MEGTPTLLNVIFRKITAHKSTFLQLPNYISIHKQKSNRCVASFAELPISWEFFINKYSILKVPSGIGKVALGSDQGFMDVTEVQIKLLWVFL